MSHLSVIMKDIEGDNYIKICISWLVFKLHNYGMPCTLKEMFSSGLDVSMINNCVGVQRAMRKRYWCGHSYGPCNNDTRWLHTLFDSYVSIVYENLVSLQQDINQSHHSQQSSCGHPKGVCYRVYTQLEPWLFAHLSKPQPYNGNKTVLILKISTLISVNCGKIFRLNICQVVSKAVLSDIWIQHDKGHPRRSHKDPEGEWRYSSIVSLTSALDGSGCSTPRSGRFTPRKDPVPIV
jgi:hypothetical protein